MISTITINYKTADYLERMLESLFAYHQRGGIQVIVVENGSGDDLSKLKARFDEVIWIDSPTNLGFAGGCNLGLQQANDEFIVLLNPDIIFTDGALYQIRDAMRAHPDIGIGGISLKNLDGTQQACVWHFPEPFSQMLVLFKLHHLLPNIGPVAHWRMDDFDYGQDSDVDQVMGAFFCIRRKVIDSIGPLDQGFFIWYEEVDYCKRAREAGWRVHYFSGIQARHKKGSSFDRVPTVQKQNVLRRSVRRYMRKHYGPMVGLVFWILEPVFYLMSLLASLIKPM
ncbi:glycosyltransferase family 2 protein [Candidatus Uhrbacteria bacterium]|nr:glycosyltransferase family 2 protein [Candidatus Uhrbacteria bacterium]